MLATLWLGSLGSTQNTLATCSGDDRGPSGQCKFVSHRGQPCWPAGNSSAMPDGQQAVAGF